MQKIGSDSFFLPGFFVEHEDTVIQAVKSILKASYWNDIHTKSGHKMSIQITNCGDRGWFSDSKGYRYTDVHPVTHQPWPPMPDFLKTLAIQAADSVGFEGFNPDSCLLNRYTVGTKLSLHQDKDEKDFTHPIVSLSLGIPAEFLWGGMNREDPCQKLILLHGDAVVFGGKDRLRFHGVSPIKAHMHPVLGNVRINLTFRKST